MIEWYRLKLFLSYATSLSMDALHIVAGVVALFLFARLFRRTIADVRPWLAVLLFELLNEWSDLRFEEWPEPASQYGEAAKDILLTMILPTLLLLVARYRPRLIVVAPDPEPADEAAD